MRVKNLDLRLDMVAPVIYADAPHQVTQRGIVVPLDVREELKRLLAAFNAANGVERVPYYRIDAYFDERTLWVLEINASFVDGWGTALNLSRAAGVPVSNWTKLQFPRLFATKSSVYMPELQLAVSELAIMGFCGHRVTVWNDFPAEPLYAYARVGSKDMPNILPYDGLRLDNKLNLGLLSRDWRGERVGIPMHYIGDTQTWESVPSDAVLKFCDKSSDEARRARASVLLGKPQGKAPFLSRCFREKKLLAQDRIRASRDDAGMNCQLVILAIGDQPITGYTQYSHSEIINDNSVHAPLSI